MKPLGEQIFEDGGVFEHILKMKTNKTPKEEEKMEKKVRESVEKRFQPEREKIIDRSIEDIYEQGRPVGASGFAEGFDEIEDNTPKGIMPPPGPPIKLEPELPEIPIPGPIAPPPPPNKFDRLADWQKFHQRMIEYLQIPIQKYGAANEMNDLLHYTGLRVMCWHLLKYSLRVWLGYGKRHDFEKIAHFAQMAWTRARSEGRVAPFFEESEIQKREFISKG